MAQAFMIAFSVVTMIPFLGSMLPMREPLVTTVRIFAGTGDETNGNAPNVAAWDINGALIGSVKGGAMVAKGSPWDAKIKQKADGGKDNAAGQAQYISLSVAEKGKGNNALCIAGITVTWPDGLQFAWYGDSAEYCGAPWYYSSTILSSKDLYTPKCFWIDGDGTDGITTKGFAMHLPSFVATQERAQSMQEDKDLWCNVKPRQHFYDTPLGMEQPVPTYDFKFEDTTLLDVDPAATKNPANWKLTSTVDPNAKADDKKDDDKKDDDKKDDDKKDDDKDKDDDDKKRRDIDVNHSGNQTTITHQSSHERFRGQLVKSGQQHHSAKQLCQSPHSFGPDFYSNEEGIFCDMDTHTTYPACSEQIKNSCFDVQENRMRGGAMNSRRDDRTGARIVRKRYTTVSNW